LALQTPVFTGQNGVEVTGDWPNFVLDYSGAVGNGTVTSVAVGEGLTLTGNPNVAPNISITNTGVAAGDYAGLVITPTGQIEEIPAGFAPISEIEFTDDVGTIVRIGGKATVTMAAA